MSERDRAARSSGLVGGRRDLWIWLLATLGFLALVWLLLGSFIFGPEGRIASSGIGDAARYFVFMRGYGFEQLRAGHIPLWNPHSFSGTPFVGVFQSAMFYPPNGLYLLLPLQRAINLDFALHLFLMGIAVFAWLRGRALHPLAAFFSAVMVMLGAPFFLRVLAGQLSVLGTLVWSPWVLLSVDRLAERRSLGWTLVGIFATTMMLLAGHPPTVFMAGAVTALYCVDPLVFGRRRLSFAISLLPIAVAPLLLSAVQLWTGLQVASEGLRSGGMSWDFATAFSFPPENLTTLLMSDALGDGVGFKRTYWGRWFYWDASFYMGAVGLVAAIHGALRGRGDLRRVALVLAPLIGAVALGRYTPVYGLLYDFVPGFDQLRAPSKFMFHAGLFTAALAGVGLDRLLSRERSARGATVAAGLIAVALGAVAIWAWSVPPDSPDAFSPVRILAAANDQRELMPAYFTRWNALLVRRLPLFALLFAGSALLLRLAPRRRWAVWGLVILGIADLGHFAYANRGGAWIGAENRRRPNLAETYRRAGGDRVFLRGRTSDIAMQTPGYDLWGYDPVVLGRYVRFMAFTQGRQPEDLNNIGGQHPNVFHPLYSMLRVRYSVARGGVVSEHPDPAPRFLLVRDYRVIADPEAVLLAMAEPDFDPRRTVILPEEPSPAPGPDAPDEAAPAGAGEVTLLGESSDHLRLDVRLERSAILVIGDAYARGWRAVALPGSAQSEYRLLPGNAVLRAVALGPGHHRLIVEYSPLAYRAGAVVSALSSAIFGFVTLLWWRRRRALAGRP